MDPKEIDRARATCAKALFDKAREYKRKVKKFKHGEGADLTEQELMEIKMGLRSFEKGKAAEFLNNRQHPGINLPGYQQAMQRKTSAIKSKLAYFDKVMSLRQRFNTKLGQFYSKLLGARDKISAEKKNALEHQIGLCVKAQNLLAAPDEIKPENELRTVEAFLDKLQRVENAKRSASHTQQPPRGVPPQHHGNPPHSAYRSSVQPQQPQYDSSYTRGQPSSATDYYRDSYAAPPGPGGSSRPPPQHQHSSGRGRPPPQYSDYNQAPSSSAPPQDPYNNYDTSQNYSYDQYYNYPSVDYNNQGYNQNYYSQGPGGHHQQHQQQHWNDGDYGAQQNPRSNHPGYDQYRKPDDYARINREEQERRRKQKEEADRIARARAEEQKKRQLAEQQRRLQEQKRREAEERERRELEEKKRREEQLRRKLEAEKRRKEEAKRRQEELKRRQLEEKKRQEALERKKRAEEERKKLIAEERQRRVEEEKQRERENALAYQQQSQYHHQYDPNAYSRNAVPTKNEYQASPAHYSHEPQHSEYQQYSVNDPNHASYHREQNGVTLAPPVDTAAGNHTSDAGRNKRSIDHVGQSRVESKTSPQPSKRGKLGDHKPSEGSEQIPSDPAASPEFDYALEPFQLDPPVVSSRYEQNPSGSLEWGKSCMEVSRAFSGWA